MAETAEIEVVTTDTPEIVVEEAPKRAIPADEGIETLRKQLEAEKGRREELERRARAAETEVYKAKTEVDETNLQLISNAIETIKGQASSLKAAYRDAMAKGDFDAAADIQFRMSESATKLLQLENGRQAMAEKPKTPPPVADPVEALAGQLTPRSAAWLRAHPECARDNRLYRKMVRAHEDAIDDGLQADSDEYFAAVESRLGLNKAVAREEPDEDGTEHAAKSVSRRSSPAAAPVSRSGSTTPSNNPRVVRLTAEEREMARLNKMSDAEYWEQKQRIRSDSRYN